MRKRQEPKAYQLYLEISEVRNLLFSEKGDDMALLFFIFYLSVLFIIFMMSMSNIYIKMH